MLSYGHGQPFTYWRLPQPMRSTSAGLSATHMPHVAYALVPSTAQGAFPSSGAIPWGTLLASSATILVALPLVASVRLLVFYLGIPIMLGAVAAPFHVHYKVAESHSPFTYYRKAITRVA
jgi:hypothetical protein